MGKLTANDLETLQNAGIVDAKTAKGIKEKGLASERRHSTRKYMKTKDGKWVTPTLYWRGGGNTTSSKKMQEFKTKFNKLVDEYAGKATDKKGAAHKAK